MLVAIHKTETLCARNGEQCTAIWSELRKLAADISRVRDCGLTPDLLNQISINKDMCLNLETRMNEREDLENRVLKLE